MFAETCPIHPEIELDDRGKCSVCELVKDFGPIEDTLDDDDDAGDNPSN